MYGPIENLLTSNTYKVLFIEYLVRIYRARDYLYVWQWRLGRCRDGKLWEKKCKNGATFKEPKI